MTLVKSALARHNRIVGSTVLGMTDSTGQPPKRIGELLSEAGMLSAEDLQKGLDYARKTALPLGRVLIMLRAVSEADLKYALQAQSLIKFESLPNSMAVRALSAAKENGISLDEALKQIAWKHEKYREGQEPEEIKRLREQIAYAEQQHGVDSIEVGDLSLLLGDAYFDNEMHGQAESCFFRSIAAFEKQLGTTHAKVAAAVWKLANLMFVQDRHDEASNQYWRIYETKVALLGNAHPEVADALHDLAELHDVQNKYADAERYYIQCIEIREKYLEPDDKSLLETLQRLAYVAKRVRRTSTQLSVGELLTQSKLVDSDKLSQGLQEGQKSSMPLGRALISLGFLTEDDLQTVLHGQLLIKSNLAPLELTTRAIRIACKRRCELDAALNLLGWTSHESGRTFELSELIRASDQLMAAEKSMPGDHPDLAPLCLKLADLYISCARYSEAELLYKRALSILDKTGQDQLLIARVLEDLAGVFICQEKLDNVESMLQRSLQIRESELGADSVEVADACHRLAEFYALSGKYDQAKSWHEIALSLKEKLLGGEHLSVAQTLEAMANCFFNIQQYEAADPLFWRAYNIMKLHMANDDLRITNLLSRLADLYNKQGKYSLADSVLLMFQDEKQVHI